MIRVTIELRSAIDPSRNKVLGVATIANDGKTFMYDHSISDYDVMLSQVGGVKPWRKGRVLGFKRKKFGAWDLLYLALKNIVGDRHHE